MCALSTLHSPRFIWLTNCKLCYIAELHLNILSETVIHLLPVVPPTSRVMVFFLPTKEFLQTQKAEDKCGSPTLCTGAASTFFWRWDAPAFGIGEIVGVFFRSHFYGPISVWRFLIREHGKTPCFFTGGKTHPANIPENERIRPPKRWPFSVGNTSTPSIDFQGTC